MSWSAVVPVKGLAQAKSRLGTLSIGGLALAFAQDTISALLATDDVGQVIVATSDPIVSTWSRDMGAKTFDDSAHAGLNPATRAAADIAIGSEGLVIVLADLPCLTPGAMREVLAAAAGSDRSFVADAEGSGTTMWLAQRGVAVDPRFGADSRAAHLASGCTDLVLRHGEDAWPRARRDVDTEDDLRAALELGVGPATLDALDAATP